MTLFNVGEIITYFNKYRNPYSHPHWDWCTHYIIIKPAGVRGKKHRVRRWVSGCGNYETITISVSPFLVNRETYEKLVKEAEQERLMEILSK